MHKFQKHPVLSVRISIPIFVSIVVSFLIAGCASAPPKRPPIPVAGEYAGLIAFLQEFIPKELHASKAQCASIALVEDQRVIWSAGFGNATTERPTPATDRTLYRIGSITKLFTATAVMRLHEQGKIDLDRPLQTYLPEFRIRSLSEDTGSVTPRNLLTHHSGLPREHIHGLFFRRPEEAAARFEEWPRTVSGDYRIGPADRFFAYSNLGFGLLGNMTAKVSGIPYADYIQDSIMAPLGMTHSSVLYKPEWDSLLSRTRVDGKEIPGSEINIPDLAAGSIYSSATDLARFMQMFFAGGVVGGVTGPDSGKGMESRRILAKATLDTMLNRQNNGIAADENLRIGLGFFLTNMAMAAGDTVRIFSHGGSMPGFQSLFIGSRDLKVGLVLLINGGNSDRIAMTAMAALVEAKLGRKLAKPPTPQRQAEIPLAAEKLEAFTGRFAVSFDDNIADAEITRRGNRLRLKVNGKRNRTMVMSGEDSFLIQHDVLGFIPIRSKEAAYIRPVAKGKFMVGAVGQGPYGLAERIRPDSVPEVWRKRVGRYVCVNPDDSPVAIKFDMQFFYQSYSGLLYWAWNNPTGRPLKILSDSTAALYVTDDAVRVISSESPESHRATTDGSDGKGVETLEFMGYRFVRAPTKGPKSL
ncbi:MAG: serine hydrolase domain-containing protein [Fibrobacteria bacterium]